MTEISRKAVEARAETMLNEENRNRSPSGTSDMLIALLARAETAERERDEARQKTLFPDELMDSYQSLQEDFALIAAERDRLAGELARVELMWQSQRASIGTLTADLAAAQKTIAGMRDALEWFSCDCPAGRCEEFGDVSRCPNGDARAALAQANKTEGV